MKLVARSYISGEEGYSDTYERVIRDQKGHGVVAGVQKSEGTVVGLVDKLVVGNPGRL